MTPFTVSLQSSLIKSTSVDRKTLYPFAVSIANQDLDGLHTFKKATTSTEEFSDLPIDALTTVQVFALWTDKKIALRLNDGTSVVTVEEGGCYIQIGTSITRIEISNDFGNEATVTYYISGV